MGLGGISIWQLAIVLLIVVMIFGTKRLKSIGSDVGSALKGFKRAMNDDELQTPPKALGSSEPDAEFPEQKVEEKNRRS